MRGRGWARSATPSACSICSAGSAASRSASSGRDRSGPSPSAKLSNPDAAYSAATGRTWRSTPMFELSTDGSFGTATIGPTSSAAASRARTSASPAAAKESKRSAPASGRSSRGSSARSGRSGSSSRTSRLSARPDASSDAAAAAGEERRQDEIARLVGGTWVQPQTDLLSPLGSAEFFGTWPRSGMMRSGTAWKLPSLAPPTCAIVSGSSPGELLPTPVSADAKRGTGTYRRGSRTLKGMIEVHLTEQLLPTPRSCSGLRSSGSNRSELSNATGRKLGASGLIGLTSWMLGFPEAWTSCQPSEQPSSSPSPR